MMNAEMGQGQGHEPGVGALLRASRLRCGEDLRDVATLLRIRYPFLEAIEEGRYGDLPGSAYAVGFVRTYAEHLGLDSKEVVRRFKAETENSARRTALDFPTPVAERSTPGGAIVFVGILVAAVAYGAWYLGTSKNSFLVDLVAPLPSRLAALVHGDEAGSATSEVKQPAIRPLTAEAGSPGSPGMAQADRPAAAPEAAPAPGASETQTASAAASAEPPAPVETPPAPAAARPESTVDANRAALVPPKPVTPVVKVAPPKPIAVPKPVPMPVASAPATPAPAAAPAVTAAVPVTSANSVVAPARGEAEVVKPPVTPTESRPAAASGEPPASPRPAVTTAPPAVAAPASSAVSERPAATAETPTVTASNVSTPAPAIAPTLGAIPAAPSPEPKPATPVVAATPPTASAPETPKPPSTPAAPPTAAAPRKPVTPPPAVQTSQTPAAQAPADQVAAIPAAPEVASPASPQGSSATAPVKASRIVVRAKLDSWIQVRDGVARRLLVTRLLRAGDTYRVPDQTGLSLLTGNAGALEIVVDGEVVPSIGEVGVVRRDVVLDADKLKAGAAVVD